MHGLSLNVLSNLKVVCPESNDRGILFFFPVCDLDFDLETKNSFLEFVAAGGIVFHKHTSTFHLDILII